MTSQKVYKKLTDIEHVLHRPDMYIGALKNTKDYLYLQNEKTIAKELVNWNPAFYKIYDELVSNSVDESKRNPKLTEIKVVMNHEKITVEDNGGIEIKKLPDYKNVYLPEFIFSFLRTSSNYDDTEKRKLIGTNGIGAKSTNIFSKLFIVTTSDKKSTYYQEFKKNLSRKTKPIIKRNPTKKSFTKITYYPDIERFGLQEFGDTHRKIFKKRLIDLAATHPKLKFYFNDELIQIKSFKDYCLLHNVDSTEFIFDENDDWQIGFTYSDDGFSQVSIVNGINTFDGGHHVDYITDQVIHFLRPLLLKKYKLDIKPNEIKNNLFIFISCNIINNKFSGQTKEKLKTEAKEFGTSYEIPSRVLNKIANSEIVKRIVDSKRQKLELTEKAELRKLSKKVAKVKTPNLIDCSSKIRRNCSINVYEGFSASNGAIKYRDPKTQAIFLLKGKILNTYKLTPAKILASKELAALIASLGLSITNPSILNLRYGKINLVTDMDVDGSHICSLLINFLASYWIDLFKQGRIYRVVTPLVIAQKGKNRYAFYSEEEYDEFFKNKNFRLYNIEYKKGLGALSDDDYKEMMRKPRLQKITYNDVYNESLDNWLGNDANKRKELLLK